MVNPSAEPALERLKLVAVIRTASAETAVEVGRAVLRGGVSAAEVTFSVPDAPEAIRVLSTDWPGAVGAGTVLTPSQGGEALEAGASFLVSPVLVPELAPLCREAGALAVLGGLTPSEIAAAVRAQADLVKVFPVSALGGLSYVKALLEPLPAVQLMVSGGIGRDEISTYLQLGVRSVALGGALMPKVLVDSHNWAGLEAHVRSFTAELPSTDEAA
jgi:2-dehydro-3-deoxyphosphogluconate aldolase/(4S)-4-hydroxy-2-oxoglutarate aldolase